MPGYERLDFLASQRFTLILCIVSIIFIFEWEEVRQCGTCSCCIYLICELNCLIFITMRVSELKKPRITKLIPHSITACSHSCAFHEWGFSLVVYCYRLNYTTTAYHALQSHRQNGHKMNENLNEKKSGVKCY